MQHGCYLCDILLETTEAGIIHCIKSKVTTGGSWWCETGHIAESLSSIYWLSNCESLVFVSVNEPGVALQRGGSKRDGLQMGYFCFPGWEVVTIKRPLSQADIEAYALLRQALFVYLWMTCFKKHLIIYIGKKHGTDAHINLILNKEIKIGYKSSDHTSKSWTCLAEVHNYPINVTHWWQ